MDPTEQNRRWQAAKNKLESARLCYSNGFFAESAAHAYYACYQAMWVAVGNPPAGLWRHGGLINEFCRGRWTSAITLPTSLAAMRKKLDKLYRLRVGVDYEARSLMAAESQEAIDTAFEVLQFVSNRTGHTL